MLRNLSFRLLFIAVLLTGLFSANQSIGRAQSERGSGVLSVLDSTGKAKNVCPLKHTDVKAEISGFLSRVVVTQEFENPFKEKIEAVYVFPLPQMAAVDDMTMLIGERTIRGKILPREEAQAVYEAAKAGGQVASLLDQERPNIFTQSVANIMPGEQIKITISYVETLKYDNGAYEFVFPMVVGPRYMPGPAAATESQTTNAPGGEVRDAARLSPPALPDGRRSGHDISLDVTLDAGLVIDGISSKTHEVTTEQLTPRNAHIRLKDAATIPNKDFILRFDVAGGTVQDAILTHRSDKGGFFTLMLQPPDRVTSEDVTPKELVFVLDTSGSMSGFPIEKAKETMKLALDSLYPSDTFNLITFAGDTRILFPEPVPATKQNLRKAQAFLADSNGYGGTEMMKAIKAALDPTDSPKHIRIVCFMTDGYVGNDMAILDEIQKHPNARVFSFGIGQSVNRFLLDKMAETGRGEVQYVALNDDGSAAARRFHERVRNPLLTDISVDWNGLQVADIYPKRIPDLFAAKPVSLTGRFLGPARGTIKLKGKMAGQPFVREVPIDFPETMASHDVLASLWARLRIDDLMGQDFAGIQQGTPRDEVKTTITQIGLEYRLLTQFTSFVAVEEVVVTEGGQPRRIDVPVETPEGTKPIATEDATLGNRFGFNQISQLPVNGRSVQRLMTLSPGVGAGSAQPKASRSRGVGSGSGGGSGAGTGALPPPPNQSPTVTVVAGVISPTPSATPTAGAVDSAAPVVTPEQQAQQRLRAKFQTDVLAVLDRLRAGNSTPLPAEAVFVSGGKAELQIWLTEKNDEAFAALKELGVEVILDRKTSKLVVGRIAIEKLEALGQSKWVKYIAPQTRR